MLYFESHVHSPQGDPTSQTLHLQSHYSLQGYPTSKTQYWVHMSSVSRVIPSQTLHLVSHVHSLQGDPLPNAASGVTHPQSQDYNPPQTLHLGHMATVSIVTPNPGPISGVKCLQ